jgi:hypothetical protein
MWYCHLRQAIADESLTGLCQFLHHDIRSLWFILPLDIIYFYTNLTREGEKKTSW